MKKIIMILILGAGFLLTSQLTAQQATIEKLTGRVQLSRSGGGWTNAAEGQVIAPGTIVSTGFKSSAVLNTGDAKVQVAQLTRLTLEELTEKADSVSTTLFLNGGRINTEVSRERVRQDFTVRSPIATASVRGTGFGFDGRNLNVSHGAVLMVAGGGSVLALPGDIIKTGTSGSPASRLRALLEQTGVSAVLSVLEEDGMEGMLGEVQDDLASEAIRNLLNDLAGNYVSVVLFIQ
jgi:hypothetical protein